MHAAATPRYVRLVDRQDRPCKVRSERKESSHCWLAPAAAFNFVVLGRGGLRPRQLSRTTTGRAAQVQIVLVEQRGGRP